MGSLDAIRAFVAARAAEWRNVHTENLLYGRRQEAFVAAIVLIGLAIAIILARSVLRRPPERGRVAVPALLDWARTSGLSFARHGALLLFLAGLPFFAIALADPYSSMTHQEVSFPGRRIAVMLDASSSMVLKFPAPRLGAHAPSQSAFFTTVNAAEVFIRQRIAGKYHDLISLIEFGDEAYVVTPFTNDYNNILLSLSLVGDMNEFMKFPDQGTTIAKAMDEGVKLFRAFDFLNASGNLMIIFSDGQDTQAALNGRPVDDILAGAMQTKIPIYFIRTSYNKEVGAVIPDQIWKPAVEKTGGKFYAAGDEATIFRAIQEIDRVSAGKIVYRQYSTERSEFSPFALIASILWALAVTLKLTVALFQKFP